MREHSEVVVEDIEQIESYLSTHFYNEKTDNIEPIKGNKDAVPLIKKVKQKIIKVRDMHNNYIDHPLYYLILKQGKGEMAKVGDYVFVEFKGNTLSDYQFDRTTGYSKENWYDLLQTKKVDGKEGVTVGFREAVCMLRASKKGMSEKEDGQLEAPDDYGKGIFILPSGLGYYKDRAFQGELYVPLVYNITLLKTEPIDHDGDGILTEDEIKHNKETGVVSFPDCNNNNKPDYLDERKCY